jgi:signal transduction histidine kinase
MAALTAQPVLDLAAAPPAGVAPRRDSAGAAALETDDLRALMKAVADTTLRLEATHDSLHGEVARLQRELAEANAALRRSQALAALGEVAAGIAHEVRNPLGSIQLYAHLLAEDLADRPEQAELCRKIDRAVVGLDAVVRDVLRFARDTTLNPEPTTVEDLFERGLAGCAALLDDRIEVVRGSGSASWRLHADVALLTQALSNLIRNAVESMIEHDACCKQLHLSGDRRRVRCPNGALESRIVLCVQDTGPGIPPDVRDRIFNPFFTTRKTGTGLGLAIVHRIIDAHGGHIAIENIVPAGTRVELFLPPAASSNTSNRPIQTEPSA